MFVIKEQMRLSKNLLFAWGWTGCMIAPGIMQTQPSLAGVGDGAELGCYEGGEFFVPADLSNPIICL